jgi:hypothetical protein
LGKQSFCGKDVLIISFQRVDNSLRKHFKFLDCILRLLELCCVLDEVAYVSLDIT